MHHRCADSGVWGIPQQESVWRDICPSKGVACQNYSVVLIHPANDLPPEKRCSYSKQTQEGNIHGGAHKKVLSIYKDKK